MACPTLPICESETRIDQIELAIRRALRHPAPVIPRAPSLQDVGEAPPERLFSSHLLERLRDSIEALSGAGLRLGSIPSGYPLWASLIIRCVSGLLPWYTRSLHAYARAVMETAAVTAAVLEDAERRARESGR